MASESDSDGSDFVPEESDEMEEEPNPNDDASSESIKNLNENNKKLFAEAKRLIDSLKYWNLWRICINGTDHTEEKIKKLILNFFKDNYKSVWEYLEEHLDSQLCNQRPKNIWSG